MPSLKSFADLHALARRRQVPNPQSVYMGQKVFEQMRAQMTLESAFNITSDPPPPTYMGLKVYIVSNDPYHLRFV